MSHPTNVKELWLAIETGELPILQALFPVFIEHDVNINALCFERANGELYKVNPSNNVDVNVIVVKEMEL